MAESDVSSPNAAVAGPGKVSVALRSPLGPLARLRRLRVPVQRLAFINTGSAPVSVARLSVDPVQDDRGGVAPGADLQLDAAHSLVVAAGAPLIVTLTGTAPARPGSYRTTVRLHPGTGAPVAVPIQFSVAASPAWGIGLTLLGLSVVNLMTGLDEQGAVATKLREALHKRSEAEVFVARYPEPEGRGDVSAMDRAYEAAITALSRPRSAGLLDHRLEDAAAPLAEADALAASLRHAAAGLSPADAVVAAASVPWQALQPQLRALAAAAPGAGPASGEAAPFASRLEALLGRLRDRLVSAPARWLEGELAAQMTRLRLIAASGEIEDARTQARAVQTAIRRAAHSLAAGQRLVMREGAQLAFLLGTVAEIQRGMADPDIPAPSRAAIAAQLDAAQVLLSDGADLHRIVDVGRAVNAAETALTLAASQAEKTRIDAAVTAAAAETTIPEVEQAIATAQADADKSPASKAAHLHAILDAWRSTIATISNPPPLLTRLDAAAAALDRGDLPGLGSALQTLGTAWDAFVEQHVMTAEGLALKPYCDDYAARLQRRLGFVDQELRWEEPDARSAEWDRRRDRLRLALERVAPGADCLTALLTLDKDASGLTAEIGAAAADTAGVDAAVRGEAMAVYGVSAATGPRALTPFTDTPPSELLVDRPLRISIANLDPAWGVGTAVSIGFGDGSPPLRTDAETLRQSGAEHTYRRPLSAHVTVLATDPLAPDAQAVGPPLGEGTAALLIAPAPESRARLLSDRFLSARFALALVVALVIYSWRFQARDRVFGARGLDYAEAFALGFAVNAAITELPAALAKLPLG